LAKRLTARWQNSFFAPPSRAIRKQKVGVFLKFKNSVENGLGIPLPRGVVRAYQAGSDGFPVFIGEDHTDHVGRDVEAELAMGEAFDVILERRQTVFRKTGANTHRLGWEIRIKNSKEVPQRVYLEETMPGDWRLIDAGMVYEKPDARTIRFTVDALPSGKKKDTVVTYEVEVSG